jgi:hypothetical protein
MPIRRVSFSRDEQQARLKAIQLQTLYPFTYRFNRTVSNVLFSIADTNVAGAQYDSFGFVAPETMQIVAIKATCVMQLSNTHTFAWALSFSDIFTMGDTNNGELPTDQGNIIYESTFRGSDTLKEFILFDADKGLYLSYGQTLFFYQWADAAAIAAANITMIGELTLYAKPTGLKS